MSKRNKGVSISGQKCIPVAERFPHFENLRPDLGGMFEGMKVAQDGGHCTERKLCDGCVHTFAGSEALVGILEASISPSPNALQIEVVDPAQAEAFRMINTSLGTRPDELRTVLTMTPVIRAIEESLRVLRRKETESTLEQELDLRQTAFLDVFVSAVGTTAGDSDRHRRLFIASFDEIFVRGFINRHFEKTGEHILLSYFYGELPYNSTLSDRQRYASEQRNVSEGAVRRVLVSFKLAVKELLQSDELPELSEIQFDHRLLSAIKKTSCFNLTGANTWDNKTSEFSAMDWVAYVRNNDPQQGIRVSQRVVEFVRALDQTTDTSTQV